MLTLLLVCFLSCGFTHKAKNDEYSSKHHISAQNHAEKNQHSLVRRAHRAVGTPYVFGGESLAGFDCSGLIYWAYLSNGVKVPRMTSQQARAGYAVSKSEAAPGDIVVFRVGGSGTGLHTGIYAGGDNFIHSPKPGKTVKMDQLQKKYWKEKLIGVRRVS